MASACCRSTQPEKVARRSFGYYAEFPTGELSDDAKPCISPRALVQTMAIIDSMTARERRRYQVLDGSRRRRIARGSGTSVQDVNRLVKQFVDMRRMLKTLSASSRSRKKKGGRRRGVPMRPGSMPMV